MRTGYVDLRSRPAEHWMRPELPTLRLSLSISPENQAKFTETAWKSAVLHLELIKPKYFTKQKDDPWSSHFILYDITHQYSWK
jgi:hypothetical protein